MAISYTPNLHLGKQGLSDLPSVSLLNANLDTLDSVYGNLNGHVNAVTPEDYGAIGNGVADDGLALKQALESGKPVALTKDLYVFSQIWIKNKNAYLDGQGFTIHLDETVMAHNTMGSAILFSSDVVEDNTAPVRKITENSVIDTTYGGEPLPAGSSMSYRRGYISYKGRNPAEEVYSDYSVIYWREYSAIVRNVKIIAQNCQALHIIEFRRLCHSRMDGVTVICPEGHDAAAGIDISDCYDATVTNCYAENFTASETAHISSDGYGIIVSGDMIAVHNCAFANCKHDFAAAGSRDYFSTGCVFSNIQCYRKYTLETRSNGSAKYMQQFDIHAAAHNPIISNVHLICENYTGRESYWLMSIRCPVCTIDNVHVTANGGYFVLGELADRIIFRNIQAPYSYITFDQGGHLGASRVEIDGGVVRRMYANERIGELIVKNLTIRELVETTRGARFINCTFERRMDWASKATIGATGECAFHGCTIYGNRENYASRSRGFIDGAAHRLHFNDCRFVMQVGYTAFRNEQYTSGCWEEDLLAFVLGTDYGVLGENNLV